MVGRLPQQRVPEPHPAAGGSEQTAVERSGRGVGGRADADRRHLPQVEVAPRDSGEIGEPAGIGLQRGECRADHPAQAGRRLPFSARQRPRPLDGEQRIAVRRSDHQLEVTVR